MLFKPTVQYNEDKTKDYAGIQDNRRRIMIFLDQERLAQKKLNPQLSIYGKAFLINTSISSINNKINYFSGASRASGININMYAFDLSFYGSIDDMYKTSFVLTTAYNTSLVNDHDKNKTGFDTVSLYSDIIVGEEDYILDDYGNIQDFNNTGIIDQVFQSNSNLIPDPRTYTGAQAKLLDYSDILSNSNIKEYMGNELQDSATSITYHDLILWDTLVPQNKDTVMELMNNSKYNDPITVVRDLFGDFSSSGAYNVLYNYNSQTVNEQTGEKGTALIDYDRGSTMIPYANYRSNESMMHKLTQQERIFERKCKDLEKEFGPLTLYYANKPTGDEARFRFHDFNDDNQPMTTVKVDAGVHIEQEVDMFRVAIIESMEDEMMDLEFH